MNWHITDLLDAGIISNALYLFNKLKLNIFIDSSYLFGIFENCELIELNNKQDIS